MNLLEILVPVAASGAFSYAWLMIAIPAVSAAVLLLGGKRTNKNGHWLSVLAVLASFVVALVLFVEMLGLPEGDRAVSVALYELFNSGAWTIEVGLLIDQMSILFALLITGVGSLIHIYSIGYMADDPNRRKFFAYLNLFIAAMLTLVLADSYLVLFFGWEGVGLASYLLIGFWQHRPSAAKAAKKAFVMNRVGDLGMLMAIFTMLYHFKSSSFLAVNTGAPTLSATWATLLGLMLLLAACGKSAQFPLQAWLLDAMEGPTPVSALIHAATMVTAGVYLVVRSQAIYTQTETAALAVAIIGTITLFYGAWIGCAKDDIKKVLAGSTMSQIGYLMLAAGLGPTGIAISIFHLLTHGAFKANMFLGAGSVMHGMNDDTDMRRFGALNKMMPITHLTFLAGYLAIIGFPFTSGFYSKDSIIEVAFDKSAVFGACALLGAGLTAFYMTRLMMMTFYSAKRWKAEYRPHESPVVMTIPLIILAILSLGLGVVMVDWIQGWLAPAIGAEVQEAGIFHFTPIAMVTMAVVAVGVIVAVMMFREVPETAPKTSNPLVLLGRNDLFQDQAIDYLVTAPGDALVTATKFVDDKVVDGVVEGSGVAVKGLSGFSAKLQSGYARSYALAMVFGATLIGVVYILGRLV